MTAGSREDNLSGRLEAETNRSPRANTDLEKRFQELMEAAELVPDGHPIPSRGLGFEPGGGVGGRVQVRVGGAWPVGVAPGCAGRPGRAGGAA